MAIDSETRAKVGRDPVADAVVVLLEFQEDGRDTVHRAAINNDVESNSETYVATAIDISLPGSGDAEPAVSLSMSNLSRVAGIMAARARNRIGCRLMLVDTADPDTLLIDTGDMYVIREVSGDSVRLSATLGPRASFQEPVPGRRATKPFFPGTWFLK